MGVLTLSVATNVIQAVSRDAYFLKDNGQFELNQLPPRECRGADTSKQARSGRRALTGAGRVSACKKTKAAGASHYFRRLALDAGRCDRRRVGPAAGRLGR